MLSDRAKKWLRNTFEHWAGTFYQGPRPPEERLLQHAVDFGNMYPHATRAQWASFAAGLAEEAWKSAYLQGVEWAEREPREGQSPEDVMDAIDPCWRDSPSVLDNPDALVGDEVPDGVMQAREIDRFEKATGFRARRF